MIDSNMGQAGFRIGMFLIVVAGLLVLVTDEGTAEHIISILTLIMGLIFTLIIIILVRLGQRP
jgi:hypothetical protein